MLDTLPYLQHIEFPNITRGSLEVLQVNLGYKCNQQCLHCHVNAGPKRTEMMTQVTVSHVINFMKNNNIHTLDLTGGAPELNPHFRDLVIAAKKMNIHVIDRCNLTILDDPDQENLADFLAQHEVEINCSLPCYSEENVDNQRGKGVYQKSMQALRKLNKLGYGQPHSPLILNMVYNPTGPFLPPDQNSLEQDYKTHLLKNNINFTHLYTMTNMPIKRFGSMLLSQGKFEEYMTLLQEAYQESNLSHVMCRSLINIDWEGFAYDCDFNQILGMKLMSDQQTALHISELDHPKLTQSIQVAGHCYGCTAGHGSSCGGAL